MTTENQSLITDAEVQAAFKAIKNDIDGSLIKIYEEGGAKVIDSAGVSRTFATHEEFMKFARKFPSYWEKLG